MNEKKNPNASSLSESVCTKWQIRWRLMPAGLCMIVGLFLIYSSIAFLLGWHSHFKINYDYGLMMYEFFSVAELLFSAACWIVSGVCCWRRRWGQSILIILIAIATFCGFRQHRSIHVEQLH